MGHMVVPTMQIGPRTNVCLLFVRRDFLHLREDGKNVMPTTAGATGFIIAKIAIQDGMQANTKLMG